MSCHTFRFGKVGSPTRTAMFAEWNRPSIFRTQSLSKKSRGGSFLSRQEKADQSSYVSRSFAIPPPSIKRKRKSKALQPSAKSKMFRQRNGRNDPQTDDDGAVKMSRHFARNAQVIPSEDLRHCFRSLAQWKSRRFDLDIRRLRLFLAKLDFRDRFRFQNRRSIA